MNRGDIEGRFVSIVAEQLGITENHVYPNTHLERDFKADSLDMVEIVLHCEEEFGVRVPRNKMREMINLRGRSVDEIVDYLYKIISET